MRGKEHGGRTFRTILDQVDAENCERIMERARLANRLAKSVEGSSRRRAYAVKHGALKALALGFSHRVYISRDHMRPHLLVVICLTRAWGLHAPEEVFQGHQFSDRAA
jgi:hypothetical protein